MVPQTFEIILILFEEIKICVYMCIGFLLECVPSLIFRYEDTTDFFPDISQH